MNLYRSTDEGSEWCLVFFLFICFRCLGRWVWFKSSGWKVLARRLLTCWYAFMVSLFEVHTRFLDPPSPSTEKTLNRSSSEERFFFWGVRG